jgi:solute carrier family 25 phosphate transporter 3
MPLISAAQIPDLKLSLPTASFDAPPTGLGLYLRYALAGAVCCSFTHAVLTPIDV